MDTGKYIDFSDPHHPNTIWNFIPNDGGFKFDLYTLEHARLGDSDSIYCSLPLRVTENLNDDEIVALSDDIVGFVNDSYPDFLKHAFNCPVDRLSEIQSNREIVSDLTFVVSKKRYAAHVIDDEGERVNTLKIMGLETKRSDTPVVVQEFLLRIIQMILSDMSETEVLEACNGMKIDYRKEDIRRIARPMSCKKLHIYEEKYNETGSMKGFPYQVRAAMLYNSMCSPLDEKINAGEKIMLVYIKSDIGGCIAFPMDSATLPEFINDLPIDYDKQWEKVEKKINGYLKAMGWDFASKKADKRKELFGF